MTRAIYLTILLLLVYSRGFFELYVNKMTGYAVGIFSVGFIPVIITATSWLRRKKNVASKNRKEFFYARWAFYCYAAIACLSLFVTSFFNRDVIAIGILYTTLHLYWMGALLVIHNNTRLKIDSLGVVILIIGLWVSLSGILEVAGFIRFPGGWHRGDFLRLAGSVGSKQHFSFVTAGFSMLLMWFYLQNKNKIYFLTSIFSGSLTFISLSRNGIPIIIGTLMIYFLPRITKNIRNFWKITAIFILGGIFLYQISPMFSKMILDLTIRLADLDAPGNAQRFESWIRGIYQWEQGLMLIGDNTGLFSQAGRRLGMGYTLHFESAIMQQLANYGIMGLMAFVTFFAMFILIIKDWFLRALAIMCFLNFLYYPGSESLPFIGMWFLIAAVSGASLVKHQKSLTKEKI